MYDAFEAERDEIAADLHRHGFTLDDVRDAPDRPGREFVVPARHLIITKPRRPRGAPGPP